MIAQLGGIIVPTFHMKLGFVWKPTFFIITNYHEQMKELKTFAKGMTHFFVVQKSIKPGF